MLMMKYIGQTAMYSVDFDLVAPNIIKLQGDFPICESGFALSRLGMDDNWEYPDFKTVYKQVDGGVMFSNDGSVYVDPPEPEPTPDPEPYEPTLEEVKATKLQEIGMICEQVIYGGVDVELFEGTEHFSLTEKDQINLFGKQAQMAAGAEKFEYHQDGHPCRYYTKEEMEKIIETALGFVTYQTTYCNALNMWVKGAETVEELGTITYGCDIPEEYQSEVLKDLLAKVG